MTTKNRNARLSEALLQIVGDNARGFSPRATHLMAVEDTEHGASNPRIGGIVAPQSGCSTASRATCFKRVTQNYALARNRSLAARVNGHRTDGSSMHRRYERFWMRPSHTAQSGMVGHGKRDPPL